MTHIPPGRPWKRVARIHFWLMTMAFFGYAFLGFALGPGFFKKDVLKRLRVLADDIVVTAVVPGPPAMPVVTAASSCVLGLPRVTLDWADDTGTTTWDVERGSLPLTTGLTASTYLDVAVVINTTYTYEVTAFGPMFPGSAVSLPVSVTTPDCAILLPDPTLRIQTLGGKNVSGSRSSIAISDRSPTITGVTNIPNAIIDIVLTRPAMIARISANANGYFSWTPPTRLASGQHFLSVTATDPGDASRAVMDSLVFRVKKGDADDGGAAEVSIPQTPPALPLDFSVRVINPDSIVFQRDVLRLVATSAAGNFPAGAVFRAALVDRSGHEVLRFGAQTVSEPGPSEIIFQKQIPLTLEPGTYQARVLGLVGESGVSREASVVVRPLVLLRLGPALEVTYAEAASFFGAVFFTLLFLFLLLLLLFLREYWYYLHRLRYITEYHLKQFGFISKRRSLHR